MASQPNDPIPSEQSLEFLFMLDRIESWVCSCATDEVNDVHSTVDSTDILRAKVAVYERALKDRLDAVVDLDRVAAERFRSRIEDLGPRLRSALDASSVAKQSCAETPALGVMSATSGTTANAVARVLAQRDASARAEKEKAERLAAEARAKAQQLEEKMGEQGTEVASVSPLDGHSASELLQGSSSASSSDFHWRRSGANKPGPSAGSRELIEREMLDVTNNIKGLAQTWTKTLQEDNRVIEDIVTSQDQSQMKVEAANKAGKKLLWTSQLGFFKTMFMLATSIGVFCAMIPFIIFT